MASRIFRNETFGDETTPVIEVKVLPEEDFRIRTLMMQLERIVESGESAKRTIDELREVCKHHYFYDIPGFTYDIRKCASCGADMGLV